MTTRLTDKRHIEVWAPIGTMGWLFVCEVDDYWMDFKAFEAISVPWPFEAGDTPSFHLAKARDGMDMTEDWREADVTFEGFIKWDGCCEVGPEDNRPHFCGRENMRAYTDAMLAVYEIAREHIGHFDAACAR